MPESRAAIRLLYICSWLLIELLREKVASSPPHECVADDKKMDVEYSHVDMAETGFHVVQL